MISYDEFCKLPIFKKGYVCFDKGDKSFYFYKNEPKYYDFGCLACWVSKGRCYGIQADFLSVDRRGIKPEKSLRKVGGK